MDCGIGDAFKYRFSSREYNAFTWPSSLASFNAGLGAGLTRASLALTLVAACSGDGGLVNLASRCSMTFWKETFSGRTLSTGQRCMMPVQCLSAAYWFVSTASQEIFGSILIEKT